MKLGAFPDRHAVIQCAHIAALLSLSVMQARALETCGSNSVTSYLQDAVHDRRWTIIRDCAHPERPARLVSAAAGRPSSTQELKPQITGASHTTAEAAPVIVRAGSPVELRASGPALHLALQGTALDNGSAGTNVRVRLNVGGAVLSGRVLDASTVELQSSPVKGFRP